MFAKSFVVLMTATIDPGTFAGQLKRADPALRLEDYASALRFWDGLDDERIAGIVFCENSGVHSAQWLADRLRLRDLRRDVELLTFEGNHLRTDLHYGFSELGILDFAVTRSRLLASSEFFLKVTGRLSFPAVKKLISSFDDDLQWAVDCRKAYKDEGGPPIRARTELMMLRRSFYESNLLEARHEMDCSHIEEFLAARLIGFKDLPGIVNRFRVECPPRGVGAHNGATYFNGKYYVKSRVRQALRILAPSIWL